MKLIVYLISFYLLALSLFPCMDAPEQNDHSSNIALSSAENSEDDCAEECPPFCSCGCCGLQFSKTYNCICIKCPVVTAIYNSVETNTVLSEIYLPIWQPPKLS